MKSGMRGVEVSVAFCKTNFTTKFEEFAVFSVFISPCSMIELCQHFAGI